MIEVYREITPLTQYDCFTVFSRKKKTFDFPLHNHNEFELNLIMGGKGVKRIVGDHTEVIEDAELVLVGNNLPHGWFTHQYKWEEGMPEVEEITLQFHRDLFDDKLLRRNQLFFIRSLMEKAVRGISFSKDTIERIMPRLKSLNQKSLSWNSCLSCMIYQFPVICGFFQTAHLRMIISISTAEELRKFLLTCAITMTRKSHWKASPNWLG